eukprot:TRINITY_DN4026_c0_g1_i1.p1 TRINITY_DN4026_c0_g1~~TRINITY_DN4026_c0_g1_i1.p1  ORF type:complete len:251 (+),score=25.96 TRINITY_DN4026_c0_g1_i1:43-795(+)
MDLFLAIGGGILVGVGQCFFYGSWRQRKRIEYVRNTPFTEIKEIPKLLDDAKGKPLNLKLHGSVHAPSPVSCELEKIDAAIVERALEGQWASMSYSWSNNRYDINRNRRISTFYISDGTNKIQVDPWNDVPKLQQVHLHLEEGKNLLASLILGYLGIRYPHKYVHTESILPMNKDLLVLGKVYRSHTKQIIVKQPDSGFFVPIPHGFITTQAEEDYIDELKDSARFRAIVGGCFTVPGVGMLAARYFMRP